MSDSLIIPDDVSACQALIGELAQTVQEQRQTITKLNQENSELHLTINELLQQAYRKRRERYVENPNQLKIDFGDTDEAADAADGLAEAIEQAEVIVAEYKRRQQGAKKPRQEQLPDHLPRYEVEAKVPAEAKHCEQHGERKLIGYDRTETLEFEPPKLKVRVTLYPKYVCEDEPSCGVSQPERLPGLVEGNRYDTSIAAGTVIGDCYSGYEGLTLRSNARIRRAACNTHARRKVYDARENYPLLSGQLLAMYRQLYDVEDRSRELTFADRQALREAEARPIWERMGELLSGKAASQVLPKDKFAGALNYLRNQWDALTLYLSDGRLPIDNNEVEQLMKQVAIGRKNGLFIGSVAAGERAADLLTLVSSAVRNDLDVWAYVKDVLDCLVAGSTDYAALRPDRWAGEHPEHIRQYRTRERRDRADAKRVRRARRRLLGVSGKSD
jgi:hypothetical protein